MEGHFGRRCADCLWLGLAPSPLSLFKAIHAALSHQSWALDAPDLLLDSDAFWSANAFEEVALLFAEVVWSIAN